ncbi:MAG: L-histidine N(alpha)-methyltransferase [Gemmatimonadota bacterium]
MTANGDSGIHASRTAALPRLRLIDAYRPDAAAARAELLAALASPAPSIPPKYFYDALGARLFAAITELPEYYLTRAESSIFAEHLPAITRAYGVRDCTLIDLGAGNCEKAGRLFPVLRPKAYVALDISVDYLATSLEYLQREYPAIDMLGVGTDFTRSLSLPDDVPRSRRLFFYPGSSIGNFSPDAAKGFLALVRAQMEQDGALLIGVDLVKDKAALDAAYDDVLGITAAFNLNALNHVNRIAGTNFRTEDWRHVAFYDPQLQRIEMHLEARRALSVHWTGGERRFDAGARIHTENSYKYAPDQFARLLESAGFPVLRHWTDGQSRFALFLARPE